MLGEGLLEVLLWACVGGVTLAVLYLMIVLIVDWKNKTLW
jgi:hypothetical protein